MDAFQQQCREIVESVIEKFGINHVVEALRDISQTQAEHASHDSSSYGADAKNDWLAARGNLNVLLRFINTSETGSFSKIEQRCIEKGTMKAPRLPKFSDSENPHINPPFSEH